MDVDQFFTLLQEQVEFQRTALVNETYNNTFFETDFWGLYPGIVIPYLIIGSIATLAGTVGNILIIGAMLVSNRLRTTGNMFIVNLALADLLVTAYVYPLTIIGVVFGPQFFLGKHILCHFLIAVCLIGTVCSLWNLGAIALNRYVFLCYNHFYATIYTKRFTLCACIGFWVVSALSMELPLFLGWNWHIYDIKAMACTWSRQANYIFTTFVCIISLCAPMLLIVLFYFRIYRFVHASRNRLRKLVKEDSSTHMDQLLNERKEEELQLARTLFIVFFTFFFCLAPYLFVTLYDRENEMSRSVYLIITAMVHINSSLNSIIYAASNKQFRDGYKQFIRLSFGLIRRTATSATQAVLYRESAS